MDVCCHGLARPTSKHGTSYQTVFLATYCHTLHVANSLLRVLLMAKSVSELSDRLSRLLDLDAHVMP